MSSGAQVVVVGAAWCQPCKALKPVLDQLLTETPVDAQIVHYDVDDDEEQCDQLNIVSVPTLLFLVSGTERLRNVGLTGVSDFVAKCRAHLELDKAFA
jgi:thioredoxin 1